MTSYEAVSTSSGQSSLGVLGRGAVHVWIGGIRVILAAQFGDRYGSGGRVASCHMVATKVALRPHYMNPFASVLP
jgi:hypothetical protein